MARLNKENQPMSLAQIQKTRESATLQLTQSSSNHIPSDLNYLFTCLKDSKTVI